MFHSLWIFDGKLSWYASFHTDSGANVFIRFLKSFFSIPMAIVCNKALLTTTQQSKSYFTFPPQSNLHKHIRLTCNSISYLSSTTSHYWYRYDRNGNIFHFLTFSRFFFLWIGKNGRWCFKLTVLQRMSVVIVEIMWFLWKLLKTAAVKFRPSVTIKIALSFLLTICSPLSLKKSKLIRRTKKKSNT